MTKDGVVHRSSGVDRASKISVGRYAVVFTRPVNSCAATASPLGLAGGQASVAFNLSDPSRVEVVTLSNVGTPVDRVFNLIVLCAS